MEGDVLDGLCGRAEIPLRRFDERRSGDEDGERAEERERRDDERLKVDMRHLGKYLEPGQLSAAEPYMAKGKMKDVKMDEGREMAVRRMEREKSMTGTYVEMMKGLFGEKGLERATMRKRTKVHTLSYSFVLGIGWDMN